MADKNKIVRFLRDYVDILADEPDGYIKISVIYHHLRRILGDE